MGATSAPGEVASATEPLKPLQIALRVDVASGTRSPQDWPVTTGVPFKDGRLTEQQISALSVQTAAGTTVPAQFEVRGRYPRSQNVRWLGVDFQVAPAVKEYRLVLDGKPGPAHPQPVRIDQGPEAFVVTTGDLKAEVPRHGGLLRRVWLKDELVLEQSPNDGNWLTTLDGQRHVEARDVRTSAQVE
jgi:hypothetical protein